MTDSEVTDSEVTGSETARQKPRSFIEQARRAQIADAAAEVVAEVGYAKTSFARIAEKAQISKGVITYHFTNKDEILRLVVARFFERGWEHMEPRISQEETATGQLRAWVEAQLDFFGAHRTEFLAMSEIMANHRSDDGSHAYPDDLGEEVEAIAEMLVRGQQDGEFREFDTMAVAAIIARSTEGVLTAWARDDSIDLDEQARVLVDYIDHAIRQETS